jgi:hypothetical protein
MELLLFALIGLLILGAIATNVAALWRVFTKSKARDEIETEQLPPFEQAKVLMFGTKRDQAASTLRHSMAQILTAVSSVALIVFLAWQAVGLLKLWNYFTE